ncbi:hypothetical protein [Solirubrobacter soli]|uniref:hypothetical protein n=1 Tax=Solirubrobacter soli TaxID=363832 RepID=UPI0003F5B185|nr:hypothetical protein [Solirubrobacter soli]
MGRRSGLLAVIVGALLSLIVGVSVAHACVCVRSHPAMRLPYADGAIVGTVESRTDANDTLTYVVRVERAVKGTAIERVTVASGLTSCQLFLDVGARVGLFLHSGGEATACDVTDPDELLAAADLPAPRGSTRFVAAVQGSATAVGLTAGGTPSAYGRGASPMAIARCGSLVVTAARDTAGLHVVTQSARLDLVSSVDVPLRNVQALSCRGRTIWAAGAGGLVKIARGKAELVRRITEVGTATFTSVRAYLATSGGLHVITLSTGREQTFHHYGEFVTLSVNRGRVAGRLLGGGAATLVDGRMRLARRAEGATWVDRDHLVDTRRGEILDTLLRPVRKIAPIPGDLVAVEGGAAYVADGNIVRRLAPGARSAKVFAKLPGKVVGLTAVAPKAAAAWHSCEQSAKPPLTT